METLLALALLVVVVVAVMAPWPVTTITMAKSA